VSVVVVVPVGALTLVIVGGVVVVVTVGVPVVVEVVWLETVAAEPRIANAPITSRISKTTMMTSHQGKLLVSAAVVVVVVPVLPVVPVLELLF
jgi:hypothetical protein